MNHINKIEFSPELEPSLLVFAKQLGADTAILYRFVDTKDVESAELLKLLSVSDMIKDTDTFFTDVVRESFKDSKGKDWFLQDIIKHYENGTIDYETSAEFLEFLKQNIRILRFAEYAENPPEKKIYNFDYTKRPQKYLVLGDEILQKEYCKKENDRTEEEKKAGSLKDIKNSNYITKSIKHEGMTAYVVRAAATAFINERWNADEANDKQDGSWVEAVNKFVKKEYLDSNEAHYKGKSRDNAYKISGHHSVAWVLHRKYTKKENTDETSEVIGCLRFEFSLEKDKDETNITRELKKNFTDNSTKLFDKTVAEVFENYEEASYLKVYSCLDEILKQLPEIGKKLNTEIASKTAKKEVEEEDKAGSQDYENRQKEIRDKLEILVNIHQNIEHLFFVLKRNTYYGEYVLLRINKFITDLLKQLHLPAEAFTRIWDDLRKHEELMLYDLQDYRDHFMHQFHVFITGYIFIYLYGIENITKIVNARYLGNEEINVSSFKEIDILRIWALTSLFHDCGYSFQKLTGGFETFTEHALLSKLSMNINWQEFFLKEKHIAVKLGLISDHYIFCPQKLKSFDKSDLLRILLQKGIIDQDHGVISAIMLLQHLDNIKNHSNDSTNTGFPIYFMANIAAAAIAIHNKVYQSMVEQGSQQICFELNPFVFLLVYCDTVQEWGRRRSNMNRENFVSPSLSKIDFETTKHADKDSKFTIGLKYSAKGSEKLPEKADILPYANRAAFSFLAPQNFRINAKYTIGFQPTFEVEFAKCNDKCDFQCTFIKTENKEKRASTAVTDLNLIADKILLKKRTFTNGKGKPQ